MVACGGLTLDPAPFGSGPDGGAVRDAATITFDYCGLCSLLDEAPPVGLPAASELSGIAASFLHHGTYYVHNDSGDTARFFAVDESGSLLATFDVTGRTADDWEDIAVGPCATGSCVFLGDIGDNSAKRATYTVYRVTEPADARTSHAVTADALPFRYPDGAHNAETLLVHPTTGRMFVVTKVASGASGIYAFPESQRPDELVTLTRIGAVSPPSGSPQITGGDISPEGTAVLLRTYSNAWYYGSGGVDGGSGATDESLATILGRAPCMVPVAPEPQGEAIGFRQDGLGYVTVSEGAPVLHFAQCRPL